MKGKDFAPNPYNYLNCIGPQFFSLSQNCPLFAHFHRNSKKLVLKCRHLKAAVQIRKEICSQLNKINQIYLYFIMWESFTVLALILFGIWIIVQYFGSSPDRQTDRRTYGQKATHMSPLCKVHKWAQKCSYRAYRAIRLSAKWLDLTKSGQMWSKAALLPNIAETLTTPFGRQPMTLSS